MKITERILVLGVTILSIVSCGNKHEGEKETGLLSNFVSITDNEDKGVKKILDYYGGECKYAIGKDVSADTSVKYFELQLTGSDAMEKYSHILEMPASNMAYLFYNSLKEEKNNYDEIHSVVILKDGNKKSFIYPTKKLELVDVKIPLVLKIVELIKDKKYTDLLPMLNDSTIGKYNKKDLINNIEKMDNDFGIIKEFLPYGFKIKDLNNGKKVLYISGALIRDKQSNEFSVDLNPEAAEEIYLIQYQL
ncbi:MAG: hypothetical protein K0S32_986 [Bacteroidetes bacterium]|jgi:hypothetical protein|nr:hypothetical protein [Bacteroidota bacterium]